MQQEKARYIYILWCKTFRFDYTTLNYKEITFIFIIWEVRIISWVLRANILHINLKIEEHKPTRRVSSSSNSLLYWFCLLTSFAPRLCERNIFWIITWVGIVINLIFDTNGQLSTTTSNHTKWYSQIL
jgi:hypothetical protein